MVVIYNSKATPRLLDEVTLLVEARSKRELFQNLFHVLIPRLLCEATDSKATASLIEDLSLRLEYQSAGSLVLDYIPDIFSHLLIEHPEKLSSGKFIYLGDS